MQAMILAAGFGTRLLPFPKLRPKPLFPLLNEPLLLLTIRRLQNAGFDHIIVNSHHLREQIVAAVNGLPGVIIQKEERVLGTGGGLRMALPQMRQEPLLVSNGDIYHTINYQELYQAHESTPFSVTMAMHHYPRFNKVSVENNEITGFDDQSPGIPLAFTGLHVLDPDILETIPENQEYSIIDRYREILREGDRIQAVRADDCSWTDMGTVEDYLALHGKLLNREIPLWDEFPIIPKGPFFTAGEMNNSNPLSYEDWVCIGHSHIGEDVHLRRCVVWDGISLEEAGEYTDRLLVPGLDN